MTQSRGGGGVTLSKSSSSGQMPSLASVRAKDFPDLGQTARFGDAANDRQGYGAAAYGNHLAYVVDQGDPGEVEDGTVAVETFAGSYAKGFADTAKWSGNLDYDGGVPSGTVLLKPPSGSGASGFGYGVCVGKDYVVVSAKWSQQVFVYNYSGLLLRTIEKPSDGSRYEIDNFAESIVLKGNELLIGAPNSTVDGNEDAGMAFRLDLSLPSSIPTPILAPQNDPSIQAGALVGQSLAIAKDHYVIGAPGYVTAVGGKNCITGLLQVFSGAGTSVVFERNLTVDTTKGSYPNADDVSVAGLGRSIAISSDGTTVYAGDPSCDSGPVWSNQTGRVMAFDINAGTETANINVEGGTYIGGEIAVGKAPAGNDVLYVSYQSGDGSTGQVAGYALTSQGAEYRKTLSPYGASEPRFGSLGLLGGSIVPYSFTSEINVDGEIKQVTHQRLLVTGQNFVYQLEDQLPLELEKASDPASGQRVFPGQKISYRLKISNPNPKTSPVATNAVDDLSGVLNYADGSQIDDLSVSPNAAGLPMLDEAAKKLKWSGSVPGKGSVSIGYSIKVKKDEASTYYDSIIKNGFSADRSDDNPATEHGLGKIDVTKVLLNKDGTSLANGAVVGRDQDYSYLITIENVEDTASPETTIVDDMSDVVDDADFDSSKIVIDPPASGRISYDSASHKITWVGVLSSGAKIRIRVPVHTHKSVDASGNDSMKNGLANDRGPDAEQVIDPIAGSSLTKTAYNAQGSEISHIARGKSVHYQITYKNETSATLYNASLADDLSDVLQNTSDPVNLRAVSSDSSHDVAQPTFTSPILHWSDTSGMKPGEVVTIAYDVQVKSDAKSNENLINGATSAQSRDNPEKSVKITVPIHQLPMSGGPLIIMTLLMVVGLMLVIGAIVMKHNRQIA
ncbi:isopeptide-forming domain-containing fimbrial protein [Bifidobacterium commune]|nr:isopeptide-forming domain-containing fimbrial protein [Bifidobacterium commune]